MIIFDLGGVLLEEAEINLAGVLPAGVDIGEVNGKIPRIFNRMFAFIHLIFGKDCKRDWLVGHISGRELAHAIKAAIDRQEYDSFFISPQERNLIKYGSEFILVPEKLTPLTLLDQEGFAFVKKCKNHGIRTLILSNWDPESFAFIKDTFPELFALFDEHDIVIPAHVGFIKPEVEIFEYMVRNLSLDVEKTIFVDDSATNTSAAQRYGIQSVTHRDWQQTEQELARIFNELDCIKRNV
ncbi:MAG TPA: HAD-IA family hydrolase [Candidatus Babeliales bacterium]|nr:HAD-IA family hydrolase [Candidatus Babeliales bacterium]